MRLSKSARVLYPYHPLFGTDLEVFGGAEFDDPFDQFEWQRHIKGKLDRAFGVFIWRELCLEPGNAGASRVKADVLCVGGIPGKPINREKRKTCEKKR